MQTANDAFRTMRGSEAEANPFMLDLSLGVISRSEVPGGAGASEHRPEGVCTPYVVMKTEAKRNDLASKGG
jgi:hypothetical protein